LYGQNEEIFDSLVCALYGWFRRDEEPYASNPFELFTQTLAVAMKDAPSQRSIETKLLSAAVWDHLQVRGVVHGYLQDRQKEYTISVFQAFARFLSVRAFGKRMDLTEKGIRRAAQILDDTEKGNHPISSVKTIRSGYASGPDC
jgi:hypothetical protein